jgi:chloride channel protein, CIC family
MARPADSLAADVPIADVVAFFTAADAPRRHKSYPVIDAEAHVIGMVARADVLRWTMDGWPKGERLRDLAGDQDLVVGYNDELVGQLADRMALADVGRVPILERGTDALAGLVARRDLLRVRASAVRHETEREVLLHFRAKRPVT